MQNWGRGDTAKCAGCVLVERMSSTSDSITNDTPKFSAQRDGKFLSLKNAARELSCTRRFLERRIECGELAVFRPSRKLVRVSRDELDRWVASYSHGGHLNPSKASIPETEGREAG
jgi:excisionase family DNA binding protein